MNDKKAKALRRLGRQQSAGMPSRRILAKGTNRKVVRNGKEGILTSSMALNDPQTTRGIYRNLKRQG
jgi:hypothetical protein